MGTSPRLFGSEAALKPPTLLLEIGEIQVNEKASNEGTKEPKSFL
jgi:hypothetical protein